MQLDQDVIRQRLGRYRAFNQARLARSLAVMPVQARQMIEILPVLLHYNSPLLPCYREGAVPCGIDGFSPDLRQRAWMSRQSRGRLCPEPKSRAIFALYTMGSTSSICQSPYSDLDIWVCVHSDMPQAELKNLNHKCRLISALAKMRGVELNLFVTAEDRFSAATYDNLDGDNCGSAQNLLLLDEFYRTAFKICGRDLIWYLVSPEEEKTDYRAAVEALFASGVIDERFWFDYGPVAGASPAEYFGSALWMLFKGIDSPFKAALKISLMEAYSSDYPDTMMLSMTLKAAVQQGERDPLSFDAYFLMYRRCDEYFMHRGQTGRLQLMRCCFYLKMHLAMKGLSGRLHRERTDLLRQLVSTWDWPARRSGDLDNLEHWKIRYVKEFNQALFASVIASYRELLRFSVRHGIEYAITSDDAAVLSRKLYAAFDRYPSKVFIYNEELSSSLEERALSFIFPSDQSVCRKSWHLYPAALDDLAILQTRPCYIGSRIAKVVSFACFNHMLGRRTRLMVAGQSGAVTEEKLRNLAGDMLRSLYPTLKSSSTRDLQRPRFMTAGMVIVNLERDLSAEGLISADDFEFGSSLSAGRQRLCLVSSLDLVMTNSWGELQHLALPDGEEGVVELLATLLSLGRSETDVERVLGSIEICCYAAQYGDLIKFDLENTLRQVFSCQSPGGSSEYVFEVGRNTYQAIRTEDRRIQIKRRSLLNTNEFTISILSRYGMRPEFALQVPAVVDNYASVGVVQYFFAPLDKGWDIYIIDERNEVSIYHGYTGSRAALVNAITRFYTRQSEETRRGVTHFNLPQYFVLSADGRDIHPFTISLA